MLIVTVIYPFQNQLWCFFGVTELLEHPGESTFYPCSSEVSNRIQKAPLWVQVFIPIDLSYWNQLWTTLVWKEILQPLRPFADKVGHPWIKICITHPSDLSNLLLTKNKPRFTCDCFPNLKVRHFLGQQSCMPPSCLRFPFPSNRLNHIRRIVITRTRSKG